MKKVGLALSGGTAKGFAHIGVLEVFEKNKIPIDYIAGTSMGAVVGALYASGISISEMKKIAKTTKWMNLLDFTLPDKGILSGEKIEQFLRILLKNKKFKDLEIPTAVVAADIKQGEKVIFKKGDVASALRASISLPNLFVPYEYEKRILVDGGVIDPLPVDVARNMGADVVIAVNLSTPTKHVGLNSKARNHKFLKRAEKKMLEDEIEEINKYVAGKKNVPWIIKNLLAHPQMIIKFFKKHKLAIPEVLKVNSNVFGIMTNELTKYSLNFADYVIKPNLGKTSSYDFDRVNCIINKGKKAANSSVREIKSLIK